MPNDRGTPLGGNQIPVPATGAPVVLERRFGVDNPEPMRRWLEEVRGVGSAAVNDSSSKEATTKGEKQMTTEAATETAAAGGGRHYKSPRYSVPHIPGRRAARDAGETRLLTVPEVSKILGLSDTYVAALIKAGKLPARNVGHGKRRKHYVIPATALLRFMANPANFGPRARTMMAGGPEPQIDVLIRLRRGSKVLGKSRGRGFAVTRLGPFRTVLGVMRLLEKAHRNGGGAE